MKYVGNYKIVRASGRVIARGTISEDGAEARIHLSKMRYKLGGWMECAADGGKNDGKTLGFEGYVYPRIFTQVYRFSNVVKFIPGQRAELVQLTKDAAFVEVQCMKKQRYWYRVKFPRKAFMRATAWDEVRNRRCFVSRFQR